MTNKKSILTYVLAICLIMPAMLMFTACGKPISEKGKKYSVANKNTDITIHWGDDKAAQLEEVGNEKNAKDVFASFTISFDNDGKVVISTSTFVDKGRFYVINEYNCIEFYDSKEDAENQVNRVTKDYLSAEYKFSADKKVITIKTSISDDSNETIVQKSSVVIKLTVNA